MSGYDMRELAEIALAEILNRNIHWTPLCKTFHCETPLSDDEVRMSYALHGTPFTFDAWNEGVKK